MCKIDSSSRLPTIPRRMYLSKCGCSENHYNRTWTRYLAPAHDGRTLNRQPPVFMRAPGVLCLDLVQKCPVYLPTVRSFFRQIRLRSRTPLLSIRHFHTSKLAS